MKTRNAFILAVAATAICCLMLIFRTATIRTVSAQTTEASSESDPVTRPTEDIFLHGDVSDSDSVLGKTERDEYDAFLGRTPRQSNAWAEIARANDSWKHSKFTDAIKEWQRIASDNHDTDVAYAALSNVALGCKQLKKEQSHVEALQLLLLLPLPTVKDIGMEYNNYRHDACVALADHYEGKGLNGLAIHFLTRALEVDERHDTCGVYWISVVTDLKSRRSRLMDTPTTNQSK